MNAHSKKHVSAMTNDQWPWLLSIVHIWPIKVCFLFFLLAFHNLFINFKGCIRKDLQEKRWTKVNSSEGMLLCINITTFTLISILTFHLIFHLCRILFENLFLRLGCLIHNSTRCASFQARCHTILLII